MRYNTLSLTLIPPMVTILDLGMRILGTSRSTFFKTCIFLDQQTSCLVVRLFDVIQIVMMMQGNDQAGNGVAKHDLGIPGKVKMAGSFRWTKFCFFISFSPTRRLDSLSSSSTSPSLPSTMPSSLSTTPTSQATTSTSSRHKKHDVRLQ